MNGSSEPDVRGLIVATQKTEDDRRIPCALLRVCGITLLERHIRQMRNLGIRQIVVLAADRDARLQSEMDRLKKLKVNLTLVNGAQDLSRVPAETGCRWMLTDGSALVDFRLPGVVASQRGETVAVAPPEKLPRADAERGIRVDTDSQGYVFAGCARVSDRWVRELSPGSGRHWAADLLSMVLRSIPESALDVTLLPGHIHDMRRDLPYYWLPIRNRSDSRRGKDFLISASQKDVLDWPALLIHRPVENWIVRYVCEWPITPNQLTLICNIVAYWAAYHFALGSMGWAMLGALIVGVLDGVDGKQARVKQMMSRLGGILEHLCDSIYEYAWQFAIGFRLAGQGHGGVPYGMAVFIVGVDMAEKVLLTLFERKRGMSLNVYSPFDRAFRIIVGRRNTYMWTLIPFVVFDALWVGYWVIAVYALMTLLERACRVGYLLIFRPVKKEDN